jgi:hypothetical protein
VLLLLIVAVVIITALPASVAARFLPSGVAASDFSGSVWHGSAGRLVVAGRDAGALEWRVHPLALLGLTVAADLHWVKVSFVLDASVQVQRKGFSAHDLHGGGPIADLRDLGLAPGWQGTATIDLSELKSDYASISAAVGDVKVSGITSTQIAAGANLGSYDLSLAPGAIEPSGNINARLVDTGGPLEVEASIQYSPAQRTGLLSGTLRERPGAPAQLRSQLEPRDAQGRIPAELEFRF